MQRVYLRLRGFEALPSFFSVPLIRFLVARSIGYADCTGVRIQFSVIMFSFKHSTADRPYDWTLGGYLHGD